MSASLFFHYCVRLLLLGLEICGKSRWLSKIARAAYFAVEAIFVR